MFKDLKKQLKRQTELRDLLIQLEADPSEIMEVELDMVQTATKIMRAVREMN